MGRPIRAIAALLRAVVYVLRMLAGYATYVVTGRTPPFSHRSMVGLFCLTGGRSNDLMSGLIALASPKYRFDAVQGVLGDMRDSTVRLTALHDLRTRGYHIFERRLSEGACDRLLKFALEHPCNSRAMDGGGRGAVIRGAYPREQPTAVRYDFDIRDLLQNPDVQALLADPSFPYVAQEYLGSRPIIDVLGMWWHTAYSRIPDSEAAQYFHFDMDRPKWLKYFIYLTDVTTDSGPHSFVAGSQRTGGIPKALLTKGYSRLLDEEVAAAFDARDVIEFAAPRGTILAEDTRGLHKGKHVHLGDRLVLQIQFSNSLFGAEYPKAALGSRLVPELKASILRYPSLYAAYREN